MPAWGIILTLLAAAMLAGLVIIIFAHRPGAERHARRGDDECDVLAKVVSCMPSAPRVEYAQRR